MPSLRLTPVQKQCIIHGRKKRHCSIRADISWMSQQAVAACVSKCFAQSITYPLETCKMYQQTGKPLPAWPKDWGALYKGFPVFLPYTIVHTFIQFSCYFTFLEHMRLVLPSSWSQEPAIFLASAGTALLTMLYKTPIQFYLRNKALNKKCCVIPLSAFSKTYCFMVFEDAHDQFCKFALNCRLCGMIPNPYTLSVVVGLLTSILTAPLDYIKTRIMCVEPQTKAQAQVQVNEQIVIQDCFVGASFRTLQVTISTTLFFVVYGVLQPRPCYVV